LCEGNHQTIIGIRRWQLRSRPVGGVGAKVR
jgi:hypothetical protein